MVSDNILVTMRDCRKFGICKQSKIWAREHGIDFKTFCKTGIPIQQIEAVNDAMAKDFCKKVRDDRGRV